MGKCPWKWETVERIASAYLGILHAGFATVILWGGVVRFPPPTYAPLLSATNGQVWPYALLFGLSAACLLLGRGWKARAVGALLGVLANSTFSALFLVAVFMFSDAAATAWWAYFSLASLSGCLMALIWTHRPRRDRREG